MTIVNVGSINWDRVLRVPHFLSPGETLQARSLSLGPGGKGLNQSLAILRAGGSVRHIGAVGAGDDKIRRTLWEFLLDGSAIAEVEGVETGSATILVDDTGENQIVLDAGANRHISDAAVRSAVETAAPGDWLLFQNETNQNAECARLGKASGLRVAYSAAPFIAETVVPLLEDVDLLSVNAIELAQLHDAVGERGLPEDLTLLVTKGGDGASYIAGEETVHIAAHDVPVVDTTGAGDVFLGAFLAMFDKGACAKEAMGFANAAAALQVGRKGAAAAIPFADEIHAFEKKTAP